MNPDTKIRSIGLLGLAAMALWVTLSLGNAFYRSLESARWPVAPAQIVSSEVDTGTSNVGRWWAPNVEYEYTVAGRAYRSTRIRYFMPAFYQQEDARTVQASYPQGSMAKVAYDPAEPSRSVLEPGVPAALWMRTIVPIFFWSLCGYIFYGMKLPKRGKFMRPAQEETASD